MRRVFALTTVIGGIAVACGATAPQRSPSSPPSSKEAVASGVEDAGAVEEADGAAVVEEPVVAFAPRDVNHVLITGQSLAVGVAGAPPLTLTQPFGNLMFNTG